MTAPRGLAALVLAGGKGRRLGRDKALLEFEGERLVDRAVRVLAPLFEEILIVTSSEGRLAAPAGARVAADVFPGRGSVGGLYTGLRAAGGPVFACACDMPFLNREAIGGLLRFAGEEPGDVVIPAHDGVLEPLHAVYAPACLEPFGKLIAAGGFRIIDAFKDLEIVEADPARFAPGLAVERIFFNINTPDDLARARAMAKEG